MLGNCDLWITEYSVSYVLLLKKQVRDGPVAQLVRAPPCHGGGRRFESVPGRSFKEVVSISIEMAFFLFLTGMVRVFPRIFWTKY